MISLLLASVSLSRSFVARLTLPAQALTVRDALALFSHLTGTSLSADPKLQPLVISFCFEGTDLDSIKSNLALMLSAKWQSAPDGARLIPDTASIRAQEEQWQSSRGKQIASILRQSMAASAASFGPSEATSLANQAASSGLGLRAISDLQSKTPYRRAIVRLLADLPPGQLARMGDGDRVVFSETPLHLQSSFGRNSAGILDQLALEQKTWMESLRSRGVTDLPILSLDGERLGEPLPDARPKMLIRVERHGQRLSCNLVACIDARVRELAHFDLSISWPNEVTDPLHPSSLLAFAPGTLAYLSALKDSKFAGGYGVTLPRKELLDEVSTPRQHEPQCLGPTDGLAQLAKERGENLLAVLPDDLFAPIMLQASRSTPTASRFLQLLQEQGVEVQEHPGWLVARPIDPSQRLQGPVSRMAMETLMAKLQHSGYADRDDIAGFEAESGGTLWTNFCKMPLRIVHPDMPSIAFFSDEVFCKLYGQLSVEQRRRLESGSRVTIDTLSPQAQSTAARLTYSSNLVLESSEESASALLEPTEALPLGLPADAYLAMEIERSPVVFAYMKRSDGSLIADDAEDCEGIGYQLYADTHNRAAEDKSPSWSGYQMGEQSTYRVKLVLGHDLYRQFLIVEQRPNPGLPCPFEQLPASIREKISNGIAREATRAAGNRILTAPPPP